MGFGDQVGLAGLIVGLFAIGAFYLWPDKKWIGILSLALAVALGFAWGALDIWDRTAKPTGPKISLLAYEVILFKPNYPPFANIFIQDIGGDGKITVYSSAGLALTTADSIAVRKELEADTKKLAVEGGGLVFSVKAQEKRWFTVSGQALSAEQAQSLRDGKLNFFFAGTIVVNGGGPRDYNFCGFVMGNKPNVVLQCPEN